jgi:hypothetical protein
MQMELGGILRLVLVLDLHLIIILIKAALMDLIVLFIVKIQID